MDHTALDVPILRFNHYPEIKYIVKCDNLFKPDTKTLIKRT